MKEKLLGIVKSKWLLAIIINFLILFVAILLTSFSYQTSKDFFNSLYICKYHIYYDNNINFILATIIGSIQYVLPNFNCFILFQILLSCFAFISISYVLIDKFGKKIAVVLSIIINLIFSLNFYSSINSNNTAVIIMVSGFLLVLNSIYNKRYGYICWLGIIEILLGTFINYSYFYIVLCFAISFFIAETFIKKKYKLKFRKFHWFFRPYLLLFIIITALVILCNSFSINVNNSSDKMADYYKYTSLSNSIDNYTYPNYNKHKEELNSLGINENEYELLKSGYYDAENSLNTSTLEKVLEIQKSENTYSLLDSVSDFITDGTKSFMWFDTTAYSVMFLLIILIIFFLIQKKQMYILPILYVITGLISNIIIRYNTSNYTCLVYGLWFCMSIFTIYSFNLSDVREYILKNKFKNKYIKWFTCAFIVCLVGLSSWYIHINNSNTNINISNKPNSLYSETDRHPERLYVFDPDTATEYIKYTDNYLHPLWGFSDKFLNNISGFGYFTNTEEMYKLSLPTNSYIAVINNSNVYVVDKNITYRKEKYLNNHYASKDKSISYVQKQEFNKFKIYKVISK